MIELDKTKVYSLEDLTSEEYRSVYEWLLKNDEGWEYVSFEHWKNNNKGYNLMYQKDCWFMQEVKPTHNAKELFYTLENIQVDCSELSEEQIKEMADVFESKGCKIWQDEVALVINDKDDCFLMLAPDKELLLSFFDDTKTKITYEKFMELFTGNVEVTDKPKHYSKGIDTFARMEANCTKEECLAFAKGNIDKYNFRTKGQDLEDYKKIISYANWAIKLLKDD